MLFHVDLNKMVIFNDISCSFKGFNYEIFLRRNYQYYQYLTCEQQTNGLLRNSSPCVSVFLFLLCMFLSFMPLIFCAKLNIEIYFRKIIQNAQCSHSLYGTSKTLKHSQTYIFLTKLNAIVSIFHPHSPSPADASHFIPLKWKM